MSLATAFGLLAAAGWLAAGILAFVMRSRAQNWALADDLAKANLAAKDESFRRIQDDWAQMCDRNRKLRAELDAKTKALGLNAQQQIDTLATASPVDVAGELAKAGLL